MLRGEVGTNCFRVSNILNSSVRRPHQTDPGQIQFHPLSDEVPILHDHYQFEDVVNGVDDTKLASECCDACENVGLVFIDFIVFV